MLDFITPYTSHIIFVVVLLELTLAVCLDLTTAKFPNKFFIIFLCINILLFLSLYGVSTLNLMTFGAACLFFVPIYFGKILGGGDVKLILAVSPTLLIDEFISFLFMSFLWAGIFGLLKSLLGGTLRVLLVNTIFTAKRLTVAEEKIPFTVGILLGWCSYKSFLNLGFI